LSVGAFAAPTQTVSAAYAYDGQRRLVSATVSGDTVGNGTITACDASGNIWGASLDSETWHFSCASSSDQLESAVLPDGTETNFGYNADGWLTTNRNLAIAHDPSLGLATTAAVSGANASQLRFAYGGSGARVLTQVTGGTSPYGHSTPAHAVLTSVAGIIASAARRRALVRFSQPLPKVGKSVSPR
jgi:hypothetical protein